ncbi:MAG TPA: TFIIB-type zinc ribbon-containing protein [Nitrososphaeraceae archaeon]|jgi:transcription initiation factor TFIIB|nr:TFIIB-type zinc ribbon-containing protein [Nitrososphaeraceae archaeon]
MLRNKLVCKNHRDYESTITDPDSGETICTGCGVVLSDRLSQQNYQERRSFDVLQEWERSRIGMPSTLARHDKGLYTVIGKPNKDASGQTIDNSIRVMMERLRTWDYRLQARSATDRNLKSAFVKLEAMKGKLSLPHATIEKAAYIYRKVQERGMIKGRTINAALGASIYVACREAGITRTLNDIALISNTSYKELARTYRLILLNLDLKVPMIDPIKCVAKLSNKLDVSESTKRYAIGYMRIIAKSGFSAGKDPMGLAGAVVYLSCRTHDQPRTQIEVANAAGVTEVTLRNRTKELSMKIPQLN